MKDLERIALAYQKKPLKRLKALCTRHKEQYRALLSVKQELLRFGCYPAEVEVRYQYYWRLCNMANGIYSRREHEPRRLAMVAAGKAMERRHFVHYWWHGLLRKFGISAR